ncbi:MAG: tetratricopeptide repeat protein [Eudoraea sp.]|nr:tetratricopeptide repeat protein [Eudoraea sp.]
MQQHRLAAIMFTDIAGYTSLMGSDEKRAFEMLQKNRDVHTSLLEKYNGVLIKEMGDGMLISFDLGSDAVRCAIEIQIACKEKNIPLRIGIHEGEVVFEESDVFGDGVNLASRLQAAAEVGSISITGSVYRDVKNKGDIHTQFVEEKYFKNVDEQVKIYNVLCEELPDAVGSAAYSEKKNATVRTTQKRGVIRYSLIVLVFILVLVSAFTVFDSGNDYFKERGWALLMSFENKTNEHNLSGSLDHLIKSGIQQSGYVNILPQSRIQQTLKRMGRSTKDSLDFETAKEIAIRDGVHVIVKGSIEKVSGNYLLTAQIINPETEIDLYRTTVKASDSTKILRATDKLVRRIRRGLGESMISRIQNNKFLPAATTNSLEALKHFTDGNIYWGKQQYKEAITQYNKAFELDSNFVWNRVMMGMYYIFYEGNNPEAEIHYQSAERNLGSVTNKEKLWLTSLIASNRGDDDKSILALKEYLLEFPDDHDAWYNLGNSYKDLNEYMKAIEAYKEALRIDPNDDWSLINTASIYNAGLCQFDKSYEFYNKAFDIWPENKISQNHMFGFLLVKMDSIEGAKQHFNLMFKDNDKANKAIGHRSQALLNMYQGKIKSAINHLQEGIAYRTIIGNGLSTARDRMYLASAFFMKDSYAEAEKQLEEVDKISQNTYLAPYYLMIWGNLCVQNNDLDKAREINQLLASRVNPKNEHDKANHAMLSGSILIASDSISEGIQLLESGLRIREEDLFKGHLANAYFKSDRSSEKAEILFKEIIKGKKILGFEGQQLYVSAHLHLAEIYENRGQIEAATKYYKAYLSLIKNADDNIQVIHQIENKLEQFNIPLL